MSGQWKQHGRIFFVAILVSILCGKANPAHGQFFKQFRKEKQKKDKPKVDNRADYAYKTYSTLKRKEKKKAFSEDGRFRVEKPLKQVPYRKVDKSYARGDFFGHRRPPIRRSAGNLKLCRECGVRH